MVPTPDAAEHSFADLLYYLEADTKRVALLRSREEAIGAIENPSEQSARMTLLADLADGRPRLVLAPIAALRRHFTPRRRFDELRFVLQTDDEPGWDALQQRLFDLGYTRCDVVSAVGEYAVRGGIIDLFAATADAPVRIEFFGDAIESMRTLRSNPNAATAPIDRLAVTPWDSLATSGRRSSISSARRNRRTRGTRDDRRDRRRTRRRTCPRAAHAVRRRGARRSVGRRTLRHAARFDTEVGERVAEHATLLFPGSIELGDRATAWVPDAIESFVLECRPVEHFNRQIGLFTEAMREWIGAGEDVFIVSAGVSRISDILRAAGIDTGQQARGGLSSITAR